jgi:hypothetical protein
MKKKRIDKHLTLILTAIKKVHSRAAGSHVSQATKTKQGGLPVIAPTPLPHSIGRLGVMYGSQPAGTHKNTTTNRWKLLNFD